MSTRRQRVADALLEGSVLGGFSRVGPVIRRRLFHWREHTSLRGQTVAVTGATSGLGRELTFEASGLGADVVLLVRDESRGEALATEVRRDHGTQATVVVVDLGDLESVRRAATELAGLGALDAIVHNAGVLSNHHLHSAQGYELTYAVHVLGPFLLTELLVTTLRAAPDPRVVVVTSGGMYTQPLDVDGLDAPAASFKGSVAYAKCKRAQVSLVDLLRPRLAKKGMLLAAYHPGWADTEGVRSSLPAFHFVMRPLLRTPAEGVDTALWLLGAPREEIRSSTLYCDRAPRPLHRLAKTTRSDTPEARAHLEATVRRDCGLDGGTGGN